MVLTDKQVLEKVKLEKQIFGENHEDFIDNHVKESDSFSDSDDLQQKPLWEDSDDDENEITSNIPNWRKKKNAKKQFMMMQSNSNLTKIPNYLTKEAVSIKECFDLDFYYKFNHEISSIDFNPINQKSFLISSKDKTIQIFNLTSNEKIENLITIKVPFCVPHSSKFSYNGKKILIQNKNNFFVFDIKEKKFIHSKQFPNKKIKKNKINLNLDLNLNLNLKKKYFSKISVSVENNILAMKNEKGEILIFDSVTNKEIKRIKLSGFVEDFCFSEMSLFCVTDENQIYEFDIKTKNCINCITDKGSCSSSSIAASNCGRFVATGDNSGTINVYKDLERKKTFSNLVTCISGLIFNRTGEFLIAFSRFKKNAIRLIHLKSMTVDSNWPNPRKNYGCVTSVSISNNSRYIIIGTIKGRIFLFKFLYYFNN